MSKASTRREFLRNVGSAMVVASLGVRGAEEAGFAATFAEEGTDRLHFGRLEPLAALLQETPADRLLPIIVERLRNGLALRELVGAAALANARTFGGEDYIGFHTLMALTPALHMADEMPANQRALPVLKVLFRNVARIQERGGRTNEVLRPITPTSATERVSPEALRDQIRARETAAAEATFAALAGRSPQDGLNGILWSIEDATDVHRVVLPHRAWQLLDVIGMDHAHTMLRQSVRYCINAESPRSVEYFNPVRQLIPRLLDQHRLIGRPLGTRTADDAWVEQFTNTIFRSNAEQAANAVGAALAEGMSPEAIGEALSLAANQLVLRDTGRPMAQAAPNRPVGSVHGDGIGVHACDANNAWRALAQVADARNKVVCLLLAGYHVGQDRMSRGGDFLNWEAYPSAEARERLRERGAEALLREAEDAIRNRDQVRAAAATYWYGEGNHSARPMFDLLLRYAVSEDGALHAEKYYRTVTEEYAATRPSLRWRQVIALARVTASAYGQPAPGVQEATRLLQA